MARITRYCKLREEHMGENAFDCSRPNILGNPYTHIKNKETKAQIKVNTREDAIRLYDAYFDAMYAVNDEFRKEVDRMYDAYLKYDEIFIGCFCSLDESCHTDIIRKKIIQRAVKEKIARIRQERNPNADSD